MTETVAEILDAYRPRCAGPRGCGGAQLRSHPPPRRSGDLYRAAQRGRCARRSQGAGARRQQDAAALRHSGRGQGQHRRQGIADHRGVSGVRLSAGQRRHRGGAAARCRCADHRQDQSRSVRDGLVGVRSPYGIGRNLFDDKFIPGGSSAGSALAVAAGITPLALGTDTAGSGRVPAAFSNIVGLKPSLRHGVMRRRGAGVPHTRLCVGVCAHRR